MSKAARIRYLADGDYVDKKATEFSLTQEVIEKLDSIEPSAERNAIQGIKVNGQVVDPDQYRVVSLAIPEVEDNLDSISSTNALSAKQGRVLYNRIKNLEGLGKFLSNWDSTTGLPTTNPTALPYEYHSGDYYIVGRVGATNYRPEGTSYRGIPSTDLETEEVKVGDFYFFNGATWELLLNTDRQIPIDESLSTTSTNPVENRVITAALNLKANDADISVVGKTNDFNDLDNIPDIPDSLDDLSGTSDDITEGSTHLFLTSAERTKLTNTTGINTGDETNASIMSKLGAASSTTNGYLTVADWNTFNNKQGAISDLETIRSNASAGKNASDTIATYGDVVTHDANEFATAAQGGKADTALQPGDNVSELTNDAGYVTDAYHDSTKQDKLIAGANIQIASDGKTISATDTTYVAGDFDIKDLADSAGLRAEWSGKQDELIAGSNIQIAADGKTISATDTTYSAGAGISISNNNVISAIDNKASWGSIEGTLSNQTDLQSALDNKQNTLTAGVNIQIAQDGTISATDTTYTAGTGIDITNGVISNTQTSAEWGNITGTLSDQTDLQSALDAKQDDMVILKYGISTWNDFITAYNKNAVVYCRASSQSNPASGAQTRLAFMAYVNQETNPTSVEFQYYRSRSDHNSAANQLDQVFVYQLTSSNGGTWSVIERNTAAKSVAGTGINLAFGSGNMTISNTGVTSINSQTGDVTLTIPTVPTNVSDFVNDAGYITANDLPTVDTSMSDSSTNAVQNKIIKSYVDTQVQEATSGAVSDTAYGSSWNGVTGIAPSKNAVYDKISAMDTTISGKQDTISDLTTIRTGAGKGATAVQPGDNVSTLTNDAGFITKAVNDLTNYYTKSETYTKSEVADYVANFAGFKVVATLPTTDIKTTIIYLLGPVGSGADKYEEYIYSNNTWVKIGETSVDLTNYFNTSTDNSDSITQGSTNLFLTSAERTKLSNTSGTNTGDETKATIQSKLGAASSSASGYLTSTDWNTFNSKLGTSAISDTAYGSGWDADTTHAPSKNAVYDKISAMDTTIGSKADDSDVVHLSGAETIIDGLKVFESDDDPSPNSGSVTTSLTLKGKNLKKGGTAGYKYTSIDFKDKDDALIAKFSGLTTPDGWSGFMAGAGTDPTSTSGNLWLIADNATNSKLFLIPPTTGHNYGAVRYDYYNNNTVRLSTNQTIAGTKTFSTSPVVPSKTADATNTGTAIATEAQVYKKQDTISDLATIRSNATAGAGAATTIAGYGDIVTHDSDEFATSAQGSLADSAIQPGDSLSELTGTSDNITQGTTNLFLTHSERTILGNTSGTNTGDETKATITSKLGAAGTLTNGYLTYQDWNTFNSKVDGFTRTFAGSWSGGVHPVKFCSVDYTTANSENGVFIKMSLVNSHGNGQAGRFLEDVILLVTYTGAVEGSIYRYFGTPTLYPGDYYNNSYGDIFWTIDTENKIVDFYVLMHQFSYTRMTPYFRLNRSTGGVITQAYEGSGNPEYSSGTKSRALIYDYSKIPSKTSQLTNDSGFITSADLPTVNNGTLTINQGGTSKGTFTANQSSASTVNLETGKLVTQTEYDNTSGASSDGNLYIIYKTV